MNLRAQETVAKRRHTLEQLLSKQFPNIGNFSLDENRTTKNNCENMIGVVQVPVGIAGPLQLENKEYYLPLATTEGALVASVNRGCKAISEAGGLVSSQERTGQTRGPVFITKSLREARQVQTWIKKNMPQLSALAQSSSKHLALIDVFIKIVGHNVFVRFIFDTQDAMGMNMVTIATTQIAEYIEKHTEAVCLAVAGNFDVDKKPSYMSFINNRGFAVWAETVIPHDVMVKTLKTTPKRFFDTWFAKCMLGSAMSGSMGYNAQYANIIAAVFIATGQDPAHVVEGSMGITTAQVLDNGHLYVSVYLPALIAGTVGGGTTLETQAECLEILGVKGEGHVETFMQIVAGACLAGELSLIASLSQGSLAQAHKTLGRGVPL